MRVCAELENISSAFPFDDFIVETSDQKGFGVLSPRSVFCENAPPPFQNASKPQCLCPNSSLVDVRIMQA